jgi:MYXO-CTERM domain-containing protein
MTVRRLLIGGVAVLTLSGGTAYAQEQETTPPTTSELDEALPGDAPDALEDNGDDDSNTGLWGLLGLLGLAGLAGLMRRKSTYETRTVPPTGPAAPPTAHGATGVREN